MIFDLFKNLSGSIGRTGRNHAADVAGIETALGSQGYLDLNKTDGPTGYFGARMEDAIKGFQKGNGLKVDGVINPGGETIGQLAQKYGQGLTAPTPPKVPRPRKPTPPNVPGAPSRQTESEKPRTENKLNKKDALKKLFREFWRSMERQSLGR